MNFHEKLNTKKKSIMILGTSSGVGKTVIVTAICRMLKKIGQLVKSKGSYIKASENFIGVNINYLIDLGYKVRCFWVDEWISYGDPFEYEMLHYWSEYFESLDD